MQFNRDEAISRSIMSKMKTPASIVDIRLDVEEMISVVSNMDLCIGMRLHSLIYAAINRVPLIGIAYDPKIKSFMDYSGQKMCLDVQNIDSAEGMRLIDECESNREKIKQELDKSYLKLCGKAKENGRLAINLYEKGSAEP